jgi:hypothetical protein
VVLVDVLFPSVMNISGASVDDKVAIEDTIRDLLQNADTSGGQIDVIITRMRYVNTTENVQIRRRLVGDTRKRILVIDYVVKYTSKSQNIANINTHQSSKFAQFYNITSSARVSGELDVLLSTKLSRPVESTGYLSREEDASLVVGTSEPSSAPTFSPTSQAGQRSNEKPTLFYNQLYFIIPVVIGAVLMLLLVCCVRQWQRRKKGEEAYNAAYKEAIEEQERESSRHGTAPSHGRGLNIVPMGEQTAGHASTLLPTNAVTVRNGPVDHSEVGVDLTMAVFDDDGNMVTGKPERGRERNTPRQGRGLNIVSREERRERSDDVVDFPWAVFDGDGNKRPGRDGGAGGRGEVIQHGGGDAEARV